MLGGGTGLWGEQRPGLINNSQLTGPTSQSSCCSFSSSRSARKMSGFDDDFGEMVGGKEETGDLTEDPAAEFLAREQEELGDLETEIGPLSGQKSYPCSCPSCQDLKAHSIVFILSKPSDHSKVFSCCSVPS